MDAGRGEDELADIDEPAAPRSSEKQASEKLCGGDSSRLMEGTVLCSITSSGWSQS